MKYADYVKKMKYADYVIEFDWPCWPANIFLFAQDKCVVNMQNMSNIHNIQNMQNMQNMHTWTPMATSP